MTGEGTGTLVVGLSIPQEQSDAARLLQTAREDGYDYITTALPHSKDVPRSDVTALTGRWWRTSIVGRVAPSSYMLERLPFQLEWATHMGIPAVILPPPKAEETVEYARVVQSVSLNAQSSNVQLWIQTFLSEESLARYELLHRLTGGLSNVGMMLVMEPMPTMNSAAGTVASQIILLHRAIGAQLNALCFPTKVFLTNKRGYPTLAKSHQVLFTEVLKRVGRTARVMLDGPSVHEIANAGDGIGATKCLPYLQYIRHMRQRPECVAALDSEEATMENAYLDSLQRPLQPLKDHLEFSMYETFEKDPVKYNKYQEAVFMALRDGAASLPSGMNRQVTIAVVGAGRGPLVMRCIRAFQQLNLPQGGLELRVFAVEKNPSAVVFLESMARHNTDWKNVVTVVHSDARKLVLKQLAGHKIDIVVSELLGSFGDNELSPECLDPLLASECCKPSTISIPMRYTTFVAPISSIRLHADARQQAQVPHEGGQPLGLQRSMETAYVVRTHAASQTHVEQPCWTFRHPTKALTTERKTTLEFTPNPSCGAAYGCGYGPVDSAIDNIVGQSQTNISGPITVHGLVGSFSAVLYSRGDAVCEISIAPHSFSVGMFSWFPIYFPFRDPVTIPTGGNISVNMWRKTQNNRVWYEWCGTVHRGGEILSVTNIHNPNGRSSHVSM